MGFTIRLQVLAGCSVLRNVMPSPGRSPVANLGQFTRSCGKASVGPLLEKYNDRDAFNADEMGLFYQMPLHKAMFLKGEPWHGGK